MERNNFPPKKVVPFRSVPDLSEMELVSLQFHEIWNEFRNEPLHRFVTNKSAFMCVTLEENI